MEAARVPLQHSLNNHREREEWVRERDRQTGGIKERDREEDRQIVRETWEEERPRHRHTETEGDSQTGGERKTGRVNGWERGKDLRFKPLKGHSVTDRRKERDCETGRESEGERQQGEKETGGHAGREGCSETDRKRE